MKQYRGGIDETNSTFTLANLRWEEPISSDNYPGNLETEYVIYARMIQDSG